MSWRETFTAQMDREIEEMVRTGAGWADISARVGRPAGVIRQRVERTLKRHDLLELMKAKREGREPGDLPAAGTPRPWGGDALPSGHAISWGAITDGTCLEGEPFP